MRGYIVLFITMLAAIALLPDIGYAQLSPQGVIGGITRPFRQILGHFPRVRHHRAGGTRAVAAAPSNETPASVGPRLGWVGPPAWPNAYEDLVGFTFWPDDYAPRLRGRGFDVIADTITGRFDLPRSARTSTTGAAVRTDADNEPSLDRCGVPSGADSNWPATRIEQMLRLSDAQHAALDKLQMAAAQSVKNVKADCAAALGVLAPPDRLRTLVQTLWTVRDAGISMREPLKNFYDTLTATQKNSFATLQPQSNLPPDPKAASNDMNKQYQACASQNVEKAERLIKAIEMRIRRPDKNQVQSLENLHKASTDMAKLMIASCAQPIPADPMARLDSANDQLTAMNYAASTVQIAFGDFYSRLNNDQKARLDSLVR